MFKKRLLLFNFCYVLAVMSFAQGAKIHSHNDYQRKVPFWDAYSSGAASIEVDLILQDQRLFVAHETRELNPNRTLENLYLTPIQQGLQLGLIESSFPFFLLVDLKSDPIQSLQVLESTLSPYQEFLFGSDRPHGLKLVISGNRPPVDSYDHYPEYLFFDHQQTQDLDQLATDKIAMVSLPFTDFSSWGGKGRMVEKELLAVKKVIDQVHGACKPIRFWASPDSKSSWKALSDLGVDYINSDKPFEVSQYLGDLDQRVVRSSIQSEMVTLDYGVDTSKQRIDHVIFFIGDGTGLAQLSAGMYANGNQLNITNLQSIGLAKTQSADDFTTDSAAGGTALASGNKTYNRAIGLDAQGNKAYSLAHLFSQRAFKTGVITTDHVTGATSAAFFGHQKDRDMIQPLTEDLYASSLNLFIGAGKNDFYRYQNHAMDSLSAHGFQVQGNLENLANSSSDKVGYFASNQGLPSIEKGRTDYLERSTKAALEFLGKDQAPFFLMVENGHVDAGGHANEARTVVEEVIDLDRAVGVALSFAQEHPNTLIVITADHETGGITIPQGNQAKQEVELEFSTEDHTAIMVPVFAYGPHSRSFIGVYENTEVFQKILEIVSTYHP